MPQPEFSRALVIRGGALGDFLLTLPVLDALRVACPQGRLEVLAYPGIASLATASGLADAVRSIEYGPLAGFFTRGAVLDPALSAYFASFDLVLSYLYDPDGVFAENLRASGVKRILCGPHRPGPSSHAIDQLAGPLASLGIPLARRAVRIPKAPAIQGRPVIAFHPGSGSPAKNWPAANWRTLAASLLETFPQALLAVIGGEADGETLAAIGDLGAGDRIVAWRNLPLTELCWRLAAANLYLGHDTGVSHLAAVAGVPSLLLLGPTDPGVWAPPHEHVRILRAPAGDWEALRVGTVSAAVLKLAGARLATGVADGDNPAP